MVSLPQWKVLGAHLFTALKGVDMEGLIKEWIPLQYKYKKHFDYKISTQELTY
jgi:hypothetical protein